MRLPDLRALAVVAVTLGLIAAGRSPAWAAADPSPLPLPAASAAPDSACASSDLVLREAAATGGPVPDAVYVLRNRGTAACRIAGGVGIRLFDAQGKPLPLRIGPRSTMPMLIALGPGGEASFTVTYGRPGLGQCATSARIDVYLAPQLTPVSAPTSFVACAFPAVRISNLRPGAPVPAPEPAPSAAPSASPPTMRELLT